MSLYYECVHLILFILSVCFAERYLKEHELERVKRVLGENLREEEGKRVSIEKAHILVENTLSIRLGFETIKRGFEEAFPNIPLFENDTR